MSLLAQMLPEVSMEDQGPNPPMSKKDLCGLSTGLWDLSALLSPSSLLSSHTGLFQFSLCSWHPLPLHTLLPLPGACLPTVMSFRSQRPHGSLREPRPSLQMRCGPNVHLLSGRGCVSLCSFYSWYIAQSQALSAQRDVCLRNVE